MNNTKVISTTKSDADTLYNASQMLVPWWTGDYESILMKQTEKSPQNYLNGYHIFPLNEISVNSEIDDIAKFINERYQVILSAANTSGISVMMLISCRKGKNQVYLGFRKATDSENNQELFESILNGILPGKNIELNEKINVSSLVEGFKQGGLITGVPSIKTDDEKQKFNISSIIRALYGKDYTLAIISNPLSDAQKQNSFSELIAFRDKLHAIAKKTVGKESGTGHQIIITNTKQSQPNMIYSIRNSIMGTKNYKEVPTAQAKAEGTVEQKGNSLSFEQQNGYAIELEKIADQHIERLIKGLNSGLWETSVTFASKDKITCDILGGSFIGELSKPNDRLLPPPRLFLDTLDENQILFLPKISSANPIFPKILASYVTSEELALISSPPTESISGFEIKKMPSLSLTDSNAGDFRLGNITDHSNPIENSFMTLSKKDLNKHLFVCGLTGSGKTTTVKHILKDITQKENLPFLVIESAKRDYRQLLADDVFENKLNIFTIGDAIVSPIRFNPFYIQKGVHPLVHIDYLKAIFNASFSLYGPMPHIVEKCLHSIYLKRGWNLTTGIHPNFRNKKEEFDESQYNFPEHYYCFPNLTDLKNEVDNYVKNEMEYKGELRDNIRTAIVARLESLCVGSKGLMFNTYDFYPIQKLLDTSTILEMENLADDDDKAFFVGLILVLISEYRQKDNPAINPGQRDKGLQHFLVIEEAHRLLKNVQTERTSEMMGNPKGKAVEVFCNVISEMRSLGQGVAVVEQIPTKISPDVIKNSNTKIVHRLVAKDDQSLVAGSLSISDEDALYLNRLNTGHALCHKEGMDRPVECAVFDNVTSHAISDDRVKKEMKSANVDSLHFYETYELSGLLNTKGKELTVKLLNSLLTTSSDKSKDVILIAKVEFKKLLTLKNIRSQYTERVIDDFFAKQIFELLNKGIYCKTFKFPENTKNAIGELLKDPTDDNHKKVIKIFEKIWNTSDVKSMILEIVENLTIKYVISNKLKKKKNDITSVVSSFFLFNESVVIKEIIQNVEKSLGGNND